MAEEIRHFMECFKDNYELDDAVLEIDIKYRGVNVIYDKVWLTYEDLRRHKLEGKWTLNEEQVAIIMRAIVFLKSDFEYWWPKWPLYYKNSRPFIWLL